MNPGESALETAAKRLESAVHVLEQRLAERLKTESSDFDGWLGLMRSYKVLGQIEKAREVLNRFKGSKTGGLDVNRIEEALSRAPATPPSTEAPMSMAARQQLLQLALSLADRTL